ncbi:hypothetical protein BEN47_10280 [Hymenobacter lapidarius]|uniref:RNA polymerase sigma factor n=1 Tax=Hymenobacter lapidarius TaxID=1908237 RepID=A0A1G1TAL5_9BACT|nr:sigma-70 family RNA polymerase sigma factor [Hymenobacter lapidarius]OGX87933.1 hypothetical protein BEN47_10280 [Hymenobacter lapidarius]
MDAADTVLPPTPAPEPRQWVYCFGDELYRFALSRVPNAGTAEELVQETFVSALGALHSFRGQASERTWLFTILKRKIIDHYRRQARSPFVSLAPIADQEVPEARFFHAHDGHWREEQYPTAWEMGGDEGRGDVLLEQQELHAILRSCQQRLPPQQLAVFVLRFVEELPAEDICQELRITASNYWVIVHRAKLQLRRCLEKNWFQDPAAAKLTK